MRFLHFLLLGWVAAALAVAADERAAAEASITQAYQRIQAGYARKDAGAKVAPEASDLVSPTVFMVRYKQTSEIQFSLKPAPSTTWFVAEDTWEKKGGQWKLASTRVVSDSPTEWKARLDAQRKQMQAEDDARTSRRCLNGLGYGCNEAIK